MDAVKFLKEEDRMCDKYKSSSDYTCSDCPCHSKRNGTDEICISLRKTDPAKYVEIVEKWSKEHSVKTRQSEFLKMFPNASINSDGVIDIDPCLVDKKNIHRYCEEYDDCDECYKEFWLEEID